MTEKMYQESRLEKKQMRKVNKKNFLKNYTADFVNSIPEKDLNLLTVDTIVVVYDSIIVRYDNFQWGSTGIFKNTVRIFSLIDLSKFIELWISICTIY